MLPAIVLAWGYAEDGQTGVVETDYTKRSSITTEGLRDLILGDRADYVSTPVPIAFPTRTSIMQVSAGSRHSLAVDTAGVPYAWGWNKCGQLGIADVDGAGQPMKIPGFDGNPVLVVSAGGFHSAVVTVQGVFSFGGNQFGQLGEGTGSDCLDSFSPQRVTSLDKFGCKFVDVQCGGTHTAALSEAGKVVCWGRGDSGQLGVGSRWRDEACGKCVSRVLGTSTPLAVAFPPDNDVTIVRLSLGAFHTACIDSKHRLWTFGKEDYGMLGYTTDDGDQPVPQLVTALEGHIVKAVSAGGWHTMALCDDGVYAFGRGDFGRLGLGDQAGRLAPTKVENLESVDVAGVGAGGSHSLILSTGGDVYAFGRGDHGRLGIGRRVTSYIPLAVHLHNESVDEVTSPAVHGPTAADKPVDDELTKDWHAVSIATGGTHNFAVMSPLSLSDFQAAVVEIRAALTLGASKE